jgi:integrase
MVKRTGAMMSSERLPRGPKGAGSVRERGDKVEASYSYLDGQGKRRRRSKRFDTRTAARRWLNLRLAEVEENQVADAGRITVGDYMNDWLGSLGMTQLEAATVSWYRSAVLRHIIPSLGAIRLDKLTAAKIEAFLADKAANGRLDGGGGLGAASVRRLQVTLHKALDAAVRKGLLRVNPVDLADKPKMASRDVTADVWTPEQASAFIRAASSDRLAAVWRLAAMTGLRRSETCGLQWGDVDFDGSRPTVRRARVVVDGRTVTKAPKTVRSRRTVDLDAGTVAALREWRRAQLEERLRAGEAWHAGEWVASDEIGRPSNPEYITRRFSEIAWETGLPPITVKQLRHSHATALLVAGESPKVVAERLGHSSISVTLEIYSAVLPTMQKAAIDRLAGMMAVQ